MWCKLLEFSVRNRWTPRKSPSERLV